MAIVHTVCVRPVHMSYSYLFLYRYILLYIHIYTYMHIYNIGIRYV